MNFKFAPNAMYWLVEVSFLFSSLSTGYGKTLVVQLGYYLFYQNQAECTLASSSNNNNIIIIIIVFYRKTTNLITISDLGVLPFAGVQ